MNRQRIEERLAQRRAELAAMLEQFNQRIWAQHGAIAELEAQLAEENTVAGGGGPAGHANGAAVREAALEE